MNKLQMEEKIETLINSGEPDFLDGKLNPKIKEAFELFFILDEMTEKEVA